MDIFEKIRDIELRRVVLKPPKKLDYTTTWWYKHGKTVASRSGNGPIMSTTDVAPMPYQYLTDCIKESQVDSVAYKNDTIEYNRNVELLNSEFETALYDYLGIADHPKRKVLYNLANEFAVGSSMPSVVEVADELIELLT